MANLFPENTPARRIYNALSRHVPQVRSRLPLDLDPGTRESLAEAAARFEISEEELARMWLSEKAAEFRLQLKLEDIWETLTPKQQSITGRFCAGYEEREISETENIQPGTVRQHLRHAMQKFNVKKRSHLRHLLRNWDFSGFDS